MSILFATYLIKIYKTVYMYHLERGSGTVLFSFPWKKAGTRPNTDVRPIGNLRKTSMNHDGGESYTPT
jgi:hypothetical protein